MKRIVVWIDCIDEKAIKKVLAKLELSGSNFHVVEICDLATDSK